MRQLLIRNAKGFTKDSFAAADVLVCEGKAEVVFPNSKGFRIDSSVEVLDFNNCVLIPGLLDVHVHLREPGFLYKETIETGSSAAARGGFTAVCTMPNLNPVPDSLENLRPQQEAIEKNARIRVLPFGAITKGEKGKELSDIEALAEHVVGFSDDGVGVENAELMEEAMRRIARTGKVLSAHCEDMKLRGTGYIHDGEYARTHGHIGICSESEWRQIERDIELAKKTGCKYHVCHISTKESVALIRQAKKDGVDITCETAPHYLILDDGMLQEDGRFKMNPPIRGRADREALLEGLRDGTVDMIATDHAPHSAEEKSKGLKDSSMGVVGIETSFAVCYTELVRKGIIGSDRLLELMCFAPARRFGIERYDSDLAVFDLNAEYEIDPAEFLSMGKSTPFAGRRVYGRCRLTTAKGKVVYREDQEDK